MRLNKDAEDNDLCLYEQDLFKPGYRIMAFVMYQICVLYGIIMFRCWEVDDFELKSEYMYHADSIWKDYIHPDDMQTYQDAVEAVLHGDRMMRPIYYRARKADGKYVLLTTRGFVLNDSNGDPEYFGGIIIEK